MFGKKTQKEDGKKRWKDKLIIDMTIIIVIEEGTEDQENLRQAVGEAKHHLGYKLPWK